MPNKISVIDLFAGPGGLGEGFTAFSDEKGRKPFHIDISVEMEANAHQTLQLRAFCRQFPAGPPEEYYDYVKGDISRETLFSEYPEQSNVAILETLVGPRELGKSDDDVVIEKRLRELRKVDCPRVLIGGPPCQAYSLVGRARNKGIRGYKANDDHRHFLYKEYLSVLQMMQPDVFVMENVKGILSSKVDGQLIFPTILEDLRQPRKALGKRGGSEYQIYSLVSHDAEDFFGSSGSDYVIRAENYGVPQSRHRVILIGVRADLRKSPGILQKSDSQTAVGVTLADLPRVRSGLSKGDSAEAWYKALASAKTDLNLAMKDAEIEKFDLSVSLSKSKKLESRGGQFLPRNRKFRGSKEMAAWFLDEKLDGFLNHSTRGHIAKDLVRYMFCSIYSAEFNGSSPKAPDFPKILRPNHKNWNSGKFVDRFKVQSASKPSSTITSHISKDGHYFIHHDPSQCRSLTVREAARLQTFPDNYFFEGGRTAQYVQVGNAVPPLLAHKIARVVNEILK